MKSKYLVSGNYLIDKLFDWFDYQEIQKIYQYSDHIGFGAFIGIKIWEKQIINDRKRTSKRYH